MKEKDREEHPEEQQEKKQIKFTVHKIVRPALVMTAAFLMIGLGEYVGLFAERLMTVSGNDAVAFAGMYLDFIGIWVLTLLVMLKKRNRPMFRAMGSEAKGNSLRMILALGLSCGAAYNLSIALMALANGDIRLSFNEFSLPYFLLLFACVAVQSGAEELVCRLYVYQKLRKIWPEVPAVAILGNAVFFALLHLNNDGVTAGAILDIAVTGVTYSLMVYYFDSFWGPVLAHTTWNFTQSILLGLPNSGIVSAYSVFKLDAGSAADSPFYSVNFGIEGAPATVILGILICAAVYLLGRRRACPSLDIWNSHEGRSLLDENSREGRS